MELIYIFIAVILIAFFIWIWHMSRSQPKTGGKEVVNVVAKIPVKTIQEGVNNFRKTSTCIMLPKGICKETYEYYKQLYGEYPGKVIIQRHFATWCPHCITSLPIWSSVVNEFLSGGKNKKYVFLNNDEQSSRTPGIISVPTIIKFDGTNLTTLSAKSYEILRAGVLAK